MGGSPDPKDPPWIRPCRVAKSFQIVNEAFCHHTCIYAYRAMVAYRPCFCSLTSAATKHVTFSFSSVVLLVEKARFLALN